MIPIYWTQTTMIPNLPQLVDSYHKHGGAIVEYERVFSVLVYSQRSPVFEWVPPGTTRRSAGLKHALWCGLLGWWSITGFFWTAGSIINNLMGGIEITKVFTSPPLLPGQQPDTTVLRELQAPRKRQQYAFRSEERRVGKEC